MDGKDHPAGCDVNTVITYVKPRVVGRLRSKQQRVTQAILKGKSSNLVSTIDLAVVLAVE
jgi:hypothetical protein